MGHSPFRRYVPFHLSGAGNAGSFIGGIFPLVFLVFLHAFGTRFPVPLNWRSATFGASLQKKGG